MIRNWWRHASWDSTAHHVPPSSLSLPFSLLASSPAVRQFSMLRRTRSTRITSDAFAATKVALNAIQASTDAFPPLKSGVSAVIVLLEMSEKIKSNKKGCTHIVERSAQIVQDIWRQTQNFNLTLPVEVVESVAQIERLFEEIQNFFQGLKKENVLERLARQDRNQRQIEEYGRLLDEAMLHFSFNLELSLHRLHVQFVATDRKRHTALLAVSTMSESERLQLLTQIHGDVHMGKWAAVASALFFLDRHPDTEALLPFFQGLLPDLFYKKSLISRPSPPQQA
ncbi:hypothetical protein K438DRAFT_2009318 [Mycena galopus ATCC 62051]|nr:hypothetical protein K438DRAFT_2009318 [Mycena galopus ATCC 62051]